MVETVTIGVAYAGGGGGGGGGAGAAGGPCWSWWSRFMPSTNILASLLSNQVVVVPHLVVENLREEMVAVVRIRQDGGAGGGGN